VHTITKIFKKDMRITRLLEEKGWKVLRVREKGLERITDLDVIAERNQYKNTRSVHALLEKILIKLGLTSLRMQKRAACYSRNYLVFGLEVIYEKTGKKSLLFTSVVGKVLIYKKGLGELL